MSSEPDSANVHGTAIRIDGTGLLIRGPSGAGKSLLALELIDEHGAELIADDRVDLRREADALTMACPLALRGLIELRGRGIVRRPAAGEAHLHLVVDLVETLERMPAGAEFRTALFGLSLHRCPMPRRGVVDTGHQLLLLREAMRALAHPADDEFT